MFHHGLLEHPGAAGGDDEATLAVANKLARLVWAVWTREVPFAAAA